MVSGESDWPCLTPHAEGVVLALKVTAGAARTEPRGLWQDNLRLAVQAPPIEGRANAAVMAWVARAFDLPRAGIDLLSGAQSRRKTILLRGLSLEAARRALAAAAPPATPAPPGGAPPRA